VYQLGGVCVSFRGCITSGGLKYIVAVVGNTEEGIINVDYKVIMEVLIEVYFKVITKRSTTFIRSQII
jgi:hypothetical protein